MNDRQIIALLQKRDESALSELTKAHAKSCTRTARRILHSDEDAEEVWNDALLHIWNAIPPAEPQSLAAYLHQTVRNLALKKLEAQNAKKRGGGESTVSLDALPENRHPAASSIEGLMERHMLHDAINGFLAQLPEETVTIFVHRYANHRSIGEIAEAFGISYSKVAATLMRTRKKLRAYLKEEGWL